MWRAASARFHRPAGNAPGATAKKILMKTANAAVLQPCLRGTQTARFPLGGATWPVVFLRDNLSRLEDGRIVRPRLGPYELHARLVTLHLRLVLRHNRLRALRNRRRRSRLLHRSNAALFQRRIDASQYFDRSVLLER